MHRRNMRMQFLFMFFSVDKIKTEENKNRLLLQFIFVNQLKISVNFNLITNTIKFFPPETVGAKGRQRCYKHLVISKTKNKLPRVIYQVIRTRKSCIIIIIIIEMFYYRNSV